MLASHRDCLSARRNWGAVFGMKAPNITKWICSSSPNSWKCRLFWENVLERSCCDVCFVPGLGSPPAFCYTRGLLTFSHVWLWKEKQISRGIWDHQQKKWKKTLKMADMKATLWLNPMTPALITEERYAYSCVVWRRLLEAANRNFFLVVGLEHIRLAVGQGSIEISFRMGRS